MRGLSLLLAAILAFGSVSCRRRAPVPRPNVVVIQAASLSVRLGCYGDGARTPHVDRLAAQGRRFQRAYRQYPDFARARASWTTGRGPDGAEPPDGAPALPALLRGARYAVAEVGEVTGDAAEVARQAASEIERSRDGRAQDRPFFVSVSLPAPPPGWLPPAEYLAGYSVRDVVLPPPGDVRATVPAIALADAGEAITPAPTPPPTDHLARMVVAERAGASYVDAQVGVILAALDRAALWDTTVVVLMGEAAAPDAPGLRTDLLREDALRVPLIIAGPGVARPGRAATAPVELLDVLPTLGDLTGVRGEWDGRSLRPLLESPGADWPAGAVSVVRRRADPLARSVRTERWRYTEWPDGSRELFDHAADPGEHVNLAHRPDHAATVQGLRKLLSPETRPATPSPPAPAAPAPPLNVLLVTVDDLSARLGCYGAAVRTPHVDRLAQLGRRFDRAYAQFSSCSPSRTSFMTGWRPERTGVWSNAQPPRPQLAGAVPLQEHFRAHGYFTARVGKVFHGPYEDQFRWDVSEHTPYPDTDDDEPAETRGMASWWRPTDHADSDEPDGRAARRAAALIGQPRGRPFFIAVGFNKPHLRWVAPRRYFDFYPPSEVRVAPDPPDDWADIPEIAIARRAPRFPGALLAGRLEPEDLRAQATAAYQACTSFMDAQVGVLLGALDRARLWPRTAVVFTSDHGFHLGEHTGLWRKNTLYEESLRVPLVIVAPGLARPGEPAARVVELVDLYPTMVELARLPPPPSLDGTSLVPMLRDPAASVKEAARSVTLREPPAMGRTLRTERWRYTLWPDGSQELYDHRRDPGERRNLADDEGSAATVEDLRRQLVDESREGP